MRTPLVDWLRAQDDDTLADLLRLRPDLAVPPPADLTVLATRAGIRASVHRACDDLDTIDPRTSWRRSSWPTPTSSRSPRRRGGEAARSRPARAPPSTPRWPPCAPGRSCGRTPRSRDLALVPAVRDVVSRFPGGLGRPAAGVAASSALPELLAAVEPDERRVLETLAAGPPVGRSRGGADPANPVSRLLARGLLVRVDAETVELPRQVGLALRGDRPLGALALDPPDLVTVDRGVDTVDGTAAVAALRAAAPGRAAGRLLGHRPAACAALGRRSACASCAGSPARSTPTRPRPRCSSSSRSRRTSWRRATASPRNGCPPPQPTSGLAGGPEQKWARLARAWLDLPRVPGIVGTRDDAGRPIAALADGPRRPTLRATAVACSPGSRSCRREPPWARRIRTPSSPACSALAGTAAGRAAARRGRAVDAGRGDGAGPRRAGRTVDPGTDTARGPGPRGGGAARGAAGPDRARPAAGRPDRRRAGAARARAGARAGPRRRGRVGRRGDRLPVHRGHHPSRAGRRAHRSRGARTVRDPVGDAGAPGTDLPGGRRGPQARAAPRRRGGVVPAQRRRGADRRGARLSGRRAAGAAPDRADRGGVARCRWPS